MNLHVLLVEDNPGDADLAREWLAESPAALVDVRVSPTLADATEQLERSVFDAVLLDLDLPDSRGVDTLRRVRAAAQDVPVVVVSGAATTDLRDELRATGAAEVLSKEEANSWLFSRCVLYVVERNRAEARHAELAALLETTPDAILVVGSDKTVRYVNQAAVDLFGVERSALLGETMAFSVKDRTTTEVGVPRRDGERVCEMRVVPMTWKSEPASLASLRDVTEEREATELRRRADELEAENDRIQDITRLKSEFLANMSHELRTPLNAVIGFSQLLHSGKVAPDAPEYREFLGDILSSGRHLLRLINDILDLAKVEAGRMEFHPEDLDLRDAIREVVMILRSSETERRVRVRTELSDEVARVYVDAVRLTQVLYNFLSNALKFAAREGQVIVRSLPEGPDAFRIEVEDDGDGIDPKDLGKLFNEFQQIGAGRSRRRQGTGLGLAFTKRIVEAQGGHVGVRPNPDRGCTFFAVFPRRVESSVLEVL
ncbi:MAG: ATP-binding protein [Deltaproteobacteria bacterium]